jgi:hypothetical protein
MNKVSQFAAKPLKVELEHEEFGKTGIFVTVVGPQSKQFRQAFEKYQALSPEDQDKKEANTAFFATCVVGWDTDDFGEVWSPEACLAFFSNPENEWAMKFLSPIMGDHRKFFRKAG